ncbi:acetamidase/formamidase family protein [Sphingomonas sp. DG1-23]|uniref:acetamidase/formamidase family protein n=1 Tax=Sphingomonas sp. DG1-23 TaxID=3068316 RepID=UPI0027401C88|nr:acetamidase/formamidase family protein [Sphingomonas sp. DG1-23]MDP5280126.1 acetamidase/formamidase family protein [Sphingomonas sp. DG1-23]
MRYSSGLALALVAAVPAYAATPLEGQWILTVDRFGTPEYSTLNLLLSQTVVTGDWDGDVAKGSYRAGALTFSVSDKNGAVYRFEGRQVGDTLRGVADYPDNNFPDKRLRFNFTARRVPDRPTGGPRLVEFAPEDFANSFSAERAPVLTLWPGDTLRTMTIDSGGVDASGKTRALFGNPQTGPFFVAGAAQGDTLAIHIVKLTLNRDWADSLDTIVVRALGPGFSAKAATLGKPVRWRLDPIKGYATPERTTGKLANYRVPLRPMLGGLGLASGSGSPPLSTGDTGRAGGNMDFPEVVEGNTVYLPVQQPGALLYLGDAHALQGDGETSQYALETSMDVTVRIELIKGKAVPMPRIESPSELMVLGQAGSLDEALKAASSGLIQWLQQDYGLSLSEVAQVLGTSVRFSVPNLAGRSVGVAARIDKARLPQKDAN